MFVGEAKWQAFLRGYIRKHAWGNASADDFVGEMRAAIGVPAAEAFELYITRPGVPLANVHAECKPSPQLVLAPMPRALPAGVRETTLDQMLFNVPICVRYGDAKHSASACSTGAAIPVAFCPTWILPNAGGYGYYRSHVDFESAIALLQPGVIANVAKPTAPEKQMLVADLAAMVKRDELPIDRALPLVAALVQDQDPAFAISADDVAPLQSAGFDDRLYAASRAWSVKVYAAPAKRLGWHRRAGDSDDLQRLRIHALRHVAFWEPATRKEAEKLADRWTTDRTGLDDDLVGTALAAAAYKGDAMRFDRYLAIAKHPRDTSEARRMLSALGDFTDPALVERAHAIVLAKDFDLRDAQNILWSQLALHETRDATLVFLEAHLDELLARLRDDEASWLLGAVAGAFCDQPHRAAVATLLVPRAAKIDGAQNSVTRGLELADHCIAEVARELPALHRFFKD
jgi:alanyl aminopeptidase